MADARVPDRRQTSETKPATKTTEFRLTLAVVLLILISGFMVKAKGGHPDAFRASQVWLYVAIVVAAYSVGRGLAKSGVREYPESAGDGGGSSSESSGSSGGSGSKSSSGGGGSSSSDDDDEDDDS